MQKQAKPAVALRCSEGSGRTFTDSKVYQHSLKCARPRAVAPGSYDGTCIRVHWVGRLDLEIVAAERMGHGEISTSLADTAVAALPFAPLYGGLAIDTLCWGAVWLAILVMTIGPIALA